MFKTIRSKILIIVIGLMVVTSITFIFITTKNYQTETTRQNYKLARETLKSAMMIIDHEYNDLLSYEINAVQNRRTLMESMGKGILSLVDSFHAQQKAGILTERNARELCLKRLNEFRYEKNKYFFVYDFNLTGLSHPNKKMVGKKWTGFEDLTKRDALALIKKIIKVNQKAFIVFKWPRLKDMKKVKQLGYFLYFPKWEWIIGTSWELGEIEKISLAKEKHTLAKLNKTIGSASLNEMGGVLIFDGNGKTIINSSNFKNFDLNISRMILDKSIQDHLKKAGHYPGKPFEFSYKSLQISAFSDDFKPLDWHITTFINKDESLKAGYVIARRQFAFFILVLLAGIIFAVFISKKITHPLALLTQYARNLPDSDFKLKGYPLPVSIVSSSHNDEIKQLADSFAYLDQKVKDRTKELKRLNEHILYSEDIERRAVASDLHDSAAQTLAISISKIKTIQEPGKSISLESIAEIQGYLEQTVGDIRSMIYRLSPPILDDFGIDIALGFLIEESNKMHDTDIKYINLLDTPAHLKKSNKIAMYRTVSEIIMNIIKHSGSKNAKIELSNNKKFILLKAEDTGTGFDVNLFDEKKFSGFGLLTISEKIKNLGGSFKIVSKPGKGTKVFLSVPLGPTKK
ncbi:MAG: hypothetical protein HOJ48_17415 [Desulfobacula sp.]|jgi:signal transduction histidine kinase|nr:hypothetical protein [Desulfobacula sp.]